MGLASLALAFTPPRYEKQGDHFIFASTHMRRGGTRLAMAMTIIAPMTQILDGLYADSGMGSYRCVSVSALRLRHCTPFFSVAKRTLGAVQELT